MDLNKKKVLDEDIEISSDRSFGIVFAIVFLIIGLYPLISSGDIRWWSMIISICFLFLAFVFPRTLYPLNFMWMKLGFFLQRVVSPIVLSLVYIVSVIPIGIIMRLFKKDILSIKLDKSKESYWVTRGTRSPKKESLKKQF